jgi:urea transporter
MSRWKVERKTALLPHEVLAIAHAHLIHEVDQQVLAGLYGVNQGRISEAVTVVREACENHMEKYRDRAAKEE